MYALCFQAQEVGNSNRERLGEPACQQQQCMIMAVPLCTPISHAAPSDVTGAMSLGFMVVPDSCTVSS